MSTMADDQERWRFLTPPPTWKRRCCTTPAAAAATMPLSQKKWSPSKADLFHVIHKVPAGDSPYVRAKHVQLIDKDPSKAISLFWAAINSGDRVDSALKDMAVVMKQLDRSDEAIEAIKSFRHLCASESQESLDNVLIELYKRSGRLDEEIEILQVKLKQIEQGIAFNGKKTKVARSQGRKVQITVEKEYSRILGNLAWAYMQQKEYKSAEEYYRKALSLEPDKNKQCNLAVCLMHMKNLTEARFLLQTIRASSENRQGDDSYVKSFERACQMLEDLESERGKTDGMLPLEQWNRGSQFQNFSHENKADFTASDSENSGMRNTLWTSTQSWSLNKVKKGLFTEMPRKKEAAFGSSRNENQLSRGQAAAQTPYATPFSAGRTGRVPYTQPRRCSKPLSHQGPREGLDVKQPYLSTCKSKKSWADMVEEDENELQSGSEYLEKQSSSSQDSFQSQQSPSKYCSNGLLEEEFNDENMDSNISQGTPTAFTENENLNQKFKAMDLTGGYHTQPWHTDWQTNKAVKRSLWYDDQHNKLDIAEPSVSSLLPAKVFLSFESCDLELPSEECISTDMSVLSSSHRLQAFRDITP